jgi:polyphosphate kinase 2
VKDDRPDPTQWRAYLADAFEFEDADAPIESYRPPAAGDQDFFRRPAYPYERRLDLATYYREKLRLQIELVKLQNWVKQTGAKLLVIFEGRDAAGKGSTIKRFTEHLNPRGTRVVALEKPSDAERSQWYFQRYVKHLPTGGEIVLFDRSWYNRAGVERVMGFCTEEQYWRFVEHVPIFEEMLVDDGIRLFKFYLSISKSEQERRFAERREDPLKQWKLSPIDREAQARWDAYTEAKEETFRLTDRPHAPWSIIKADDKLRARLQAYRCVLSSFAYEGRDAEAVAAPDPLLVANAARIYPGAPDAAPRGTRSRAGS